MGYVSKQDQDKMKDNLPAKQGMVMDRMCTDVIFCALFVLFCIGMIGISGYALAMGDPMAVLTPFDSDGNRCGFDQQSMYVDPTTGQNVTQDFTQYPFKVYTNLDLLLNTDLSNTDMYDSVCAKKCPNFAEVPVTGLILENMKTSVNPENMIITIQTPVKLGLMNSTQYPPHSREATCIPSGMTEPETYEKIYKALMNFINVGFGSYINDIADAWVVLAIMAVAVVAITFLYIQLLQWITKPILYGSLLMITLLLVLCTYFTYDNTTKFESGTTDHQVAMGIFIFFIVLLVLWLVLVCCMWNALSLGASVLETASDFIGDNKYIVTLPFFAYLMCLPITIWWVATEIYIYGLGTPAYLKDSFICDVVASEQSTYLFLYEMFGFFWVISFIIAVQLFVICCSTCLWYFGGHGSDQGDGENTHMVMMSIKWVFRYHLGSLAWGAFLIAIITMIRVTFEYFVYQYEKANPGSNIIWDILKCCIRCYLKCLDCCVKFMNKNAYIQVALHNSSFCLGAKESFWIMAGNARRFTAVGVTGSILSFLGKGLITMFSVFLTIAIINEAFTETIEQPFIPAVIIGMFAYMIASVFLSVFDFSALTILHCFCLDEAQNPNAPSRNTPDGLKKFLEKDEEMEKISRANHII